MASFLLGSSPPSCRPRHRWRVLLSFLPSLSTKKRCKERWVLRPNHCNNYSFHHTSWLASQDDDGDEYMTTQRVWGTSRPIAPAEVERRALTSLKELCYPPRFVHIFPTHSYICPLHAACVPSGGHQSVSNGNIITKWQSLVCYFTIIASGRKVSKSSLPAVFLIKAPGERWTFYWLSINCKNVTCRIKQRFLLEEDLNAGGGVICQQGCKKAKNGIMVVINQAGGVILPHLMAHSWRRGQNILLMPERNLKMNFWPDRLLEEDNNISPR